MAIKIRAATPEDAAEISVIASACKGKGPFGLGMRLCVDAYTVFTRHPQTRGIVACTTDDHVVGYVFYRPLTVLLNATATRASFGFNHAVHPDYRRQGIGHRLACAWREVASAMGDAVLIGGVEKANIAQLSNLAKAGWIITGSYVRALALTRKRPPHMPARIRVRRAESSDLPAWAAAANHFYRDHNFWQPLSAELLEEWGSPDHLGIRRGLYVAEDTQGQLLAGLGSEDCNQLFTWAFENPQWAVWVVARLLRIVDDQACMRFARVMIPWYRDGKAAVARSLWQWLRWHLRQDASLIVGEYDPRSSLRKAVVSSLRLRAVATYYLTAATGINVDTERPIVPDIL